MYIIVTYLDSGCNSSLWYPLRKSNLLKVSHCSSPSIVDKVCLSRLTAEFASRISTYNLISAPFVFGGVTIGDIHWFGSPSTSFIISVSIKWLISFSTLSSKWNGVFRYFWSTAGTLSSVWIFTCTPLSLSMHWNKCGKLYLTFSLGSWTLLTTLMISSWLAVGYLISEPLRLLTTYYVTTSYTFAVSGFISHLPITLIDSPPPYSISFLFEHFFDNNGFTILP